ncbi:MAG TPA: bifunctional tetrahydrofolate synthase/dihydrofolate synthase [Steroidobacteraceae bacterium]|nr:bifunctional tetrahydrofolate synthase/dihydrofolate synthase [Steroidobacteraceae bacterium]
MRFSRLADWLSWQETLHPTAIDLGLDRLRRTLVRLEWSPPKCPVITIAGTNGKGSCVALLSHILARAGYRVGTFTSPHLVRYNERITIEGREISDASLVAAFERIDAARADETLTFFEFNALAALLVLETAHLDAIVLEVGMGGRLDAVNVVDPDVALVTSIALDHTDWLGPDVESIAREKAGIFRTKRPAVFGSRSMPQSIAAHAEQIGTQLLRLGIDFDYARGETQWTWWDSHGTEIDELPPPALFGEVQFDNAASVLQVLRCLHDRLPVKREAIEAGLREVSLAGRFQVFQGEVEWIVDVAHNPAAATTLASQLELRQAQGKTLAVCGILGDKDIEGIGRELECSFDEWIVARLSGGRAVDPAVLADRLRKLGANVVATADSVTDACRVAQERGNRGDRIVVFGSFLTVGPAIEWLQARAT